MTAMETTPTKNIFTEFVLTLVNKKVSFNLLTDEYNNLYIKHPLNNDVVFMDMSTHISISANNLYISCDNMRDVMFIYDAIRRKW